MLMLPTMMIFPARRSVSTCLPSSRRTLQFSSMQHREQSQQSQHQQQQQPASLKNRFASSTMSVNATTRQQQAAASGTAAVAVAACSSNYISTLDLTRNESGDQRESPASSGGASSGSKVLRIIWHTLYSKYNYFCTQSHTLKQLVCREANKPLPKKFRHTMRLNKSAKRKGYEFYMSDEDKR